MSKINSAQNTDLSILDLPTVLTHIFARAQRPLLPEVQGPPGLFVRYLRRKPGRGLAVIYSVDSVNSSHRTRTNDPQRSVSLTLAEEALDGAHIRFNAAQAQQAPVEILPSGVVQAQGLGLAVQQFPADATLPALTASCDTQPGSPLFAALQAAARVELADEQWSLRSAVAEPVRYKPGNRCVIRYHLSLEYANTAVERPLTLFGKVYGDANQARAVQALQQRLYDEQAQTGELPLLPRPLGSIDSPGLTLNEAVQPAIEATSDRDNPWNTLRTGTRVLQPRFAHGRGGEVTGVIIPDEELRLTAQALARLHSSTIRLATDKPRTGAKEAKRARERADLVAGRNPAQAEEVQRLAQDLATRLETAQPEDYRPAHGGFKASQLLFHSHHVFVVDFDGFCQADPALDVGYFLAYLRPSGLWYHRQGMRQWFEQAAAVFRSAYRQAMSTYGLTETGIASILDRSQLYEAALIFKIATRRVNRLNSPRPQELTAMLDEIATCLTQDARRV